LLVWKEKEEKAKHQTTYIVKIREEIEAKKKVLKLSKRKDERRK